MLPTVTTYIDFSFLLCMWMCIYVCRGCACVNIYYLYICGICVYTYIWRSEVGIKKHWTSALIIEAGLLIQTQTSQLMATVCIQLTLKSSFLHYGKPCLYVISLWVLVPDLQSLVLYSKCFPLLIIFPDVFIFFNDRLCWIDIQNSVFPDQQPSL